MTSLSVSSLTDALSDALRLRIIEGKLGPGEGLAEAGLAKQYEVARPTAKAAIERLVSEGLLERAAHKTARVPVMSLERVQDMYYARDFLESQAYRYLAERKALPEEAIEANERLRIASDNHALSEFVDSDIDFHRTLIDALGSARITKIHRSLINEMRLCLVQVQSHNLLEPTIISTEHGLILEAIRNGDPNLAAQRGRAHLERARKQLTDHLIAPTHTGMSSTQPMASQ